MHWLTALTPILTPIVQLIAGVLGLALAHRIVTPSDQARAELLSKIANDAAALVILKNPGSTAAQLLQQLITQMSLAAGLPTSSQQAIARAAAAALKSHGVAS